MADAGQMGGSGGGLGQAAGELLKEMQKAQAEMQQLEAREKVNVSGGAQFDHIMQSQNQGGPSATKGIAESNKVTEVPTTGRSTVAEALRSNRIEQAPPSTRIGATERGEENKFQRMVTQLVSGQDKMTKIMNLALSGKQFSPTELLAMQAGVYRFSQELDLTSKVVQQATSGIKQTLNTQV